MIFLAVLYQKGALNMYKKPDKDVMTFMDFDQPMGLEMDSEYRWVKLVELVPWEEFEEKYSALFPGTTGGMWQNHSGWHSEVFWYRTNWDVQTANWLNS